MYYTVLSIETGDTLYSGRMVGTAAKFLVPRTVYGAGKTKELAMHQAIQRRKDQLR